MSKGGSRQTTTQGLDPASQRYVNQMRRQAQSGASQIQNGGPLFTGPQTMSIGDQAAAFMNPYQQNVIDATRGEFDHLRAQAGVGVDQQATAAGAFGGSRHGVASGVRLGELDRSQASQIAGMQHAGYQNALQQGTQYAEQQRQLREQMLQEPLYRNQMALQMMNFGMGPTGTTQTQTGYGGSPLGGAAGGAMTALGAGLGPWGIAAGGGIGLLGSLFG